MEKYFVFMADNTANLKFKGTYEARDKDEAILMALIEYMPIGYFNPRNTFIQNIDAKLLRRSYEAYTTIEMDRFLAMRSDIVANTGGTIKKYLDLYYQYHNIKK